MLLGATVMQFMERCPDRQATECVAYHLGWKLALGLELAVGAFHPTTLCTFRERLLKHEKAKVAFDAVLSGLVEAGLVARRSNQRLDSTHVPGLVAKMSRLECVRETLRLALREVARGAGGDGGGAAAGAAGVVAAAVGAVRGERAGLPGGGGGAGGEDDAGGAGRVGTAAVAGGAGAGPRAGGRPLRAMAEGEKALLLARVFAENFEAPAATPPAEPATPGGPAAAAAVERRRRSRRRR